MRRSMLVLIASASFAGAALATSAAASAAPVCPNPTVIVQGQIVNSPSTQPCDDDVMGSDGLLGNLPVVGNLPGLGGVL